MIFRVCLIVLLSMSFIACKQQSALNNTQSSVVKDLRPTVIYKTKNNYYFNVPITLSANKDKIVSYPAPTDIKTGDELLLPTKLAKKYLLDNRGVGINSVFTKYTYSEYSSFTNLPSLNDFKQSVIDDNPFIEMWISKETLSVEEINKLIKTKSLNQRFERIK